LALVDRIDMKESSMNWDQIQGKWKQFKGSAKQQWADLTDDDMEYINGSQDKLIGKLQERYGLQKAEAQRRANEWINGISEESHAHR